MLKEVVKIYNITNETLGPYYIQSDERSAQIGVWIGVKDGLVGLLDSERKVLSILYDNNKPTNLHDADYWDIARLMYLAGVRRNLSASTQEPLPPLEDFATRNTKEIRRAHQDLKDGLQLRRSL